ncbi:MAG TPA: DegT/DnrJ/EryC1/StrS family aminotransferase [Desulfobacteraceae bacterium]|nr:DegT/DnrJ/EryC1/StrS family aminotransferase [Desulfobacteraceae bacterium]
MQNTNEQLAINGGEAVRTTPFPPRKLFGRDEKDAVMSLFDEAMEKGHQVLGYNGPQEEAYCKEFADFLGGGFADGVNSGTNAVYVALRALEPEPGSEVIVPAISDPGGVMPAAICGCVPVPADTIEDYYTIGAEQIEAKITDKTSAIIVAHIAGIPADMDPIMELANSRGIPVVEDCAQIHGAKYKGRMVGTLGTISSFSLMFGKHHATGGQGGMVFTKDEELYWKARRYADRGKPIGIDDAPNGNVVAALNCNMDELHAAIGRVQLRKLDDIASRRRTLAKSIAESCRGELKSIQLKEEPADCEGVYWFLVFKCNQSLLTVSKEDFVKAVEAEGIPVCPTYKHVPVRMEWMGKYMQQNGWAMDGRYDLTNVDKVDDMYFNCGLHEDFTQAEADDIIAALKKVEAAYLK